MRAKFRKSFSQPEAMLPDQVTPLNFDMPDVNHTFLRGHRIMVSCCHAALNSRYDLKDCFAEFLW
jgi:predicted acyl esterase